MDIVIETFTHAGLKVQIVRDEYPFVELEDVLINNEIGSDIIVVCCNPRSILYKLNPFGENADAFFDEAEKYHVFTLLKYEHSGVAYHAFDGELDRPPWPFCCPWDTSREGYVIVKRRRGLTRKAAIKQANLLLDELNSYLNGEIYGYKVFDDEGDEADSCWGFIGDIDNVRDTAKHSAEHVAEVITKQLPLNLRG